MSTPVTLQHISFCNDECFNARQVSVVRRSTDRRPSCPAKIKKTVQNGVIKAMMISNSTKFQPAELHLQRSEKFHSLLALKHVCFCCDQGQNTIDMPAQ
jgi:hypothetical protein